MSQSNDGQGMPAHARVMELATAYWISRAIFVATKLGLADLMKDGARDLSELARETGTHKGALYRLLRTLASFGFFREVETGTFENAELGATLCSDHPGLARSSVLALGSDACWSAWGELLHSVQTGETAFDKAVGMPIFDFFAQNEKEAAYFNDAMIGFHGSEPPAVAKAFDSSGVQQLVDVGGGSGNLITTILRAHTRVTGILYDLPHVTEVAKTRIRELGLENRCHVVSGSFFDEVPEGDTYTLSHIIHDWSEEQCLTILGNCREANSQARVKLIEMVIPEGDVPHPGKVLDLVMLTLPGGQERTEREYAELLSKAGYRLNRVIPTESAVSILEGVPN